MIRSIAWLVLFLPFLVNAQTYIYQPDESRSIDASLGYHPPYATQDINYENDQYFKAFTFLVNGELNKNRGVIDFPINHIDVNNRSVLLSARLSLYATGYIHSTFTGHMGNNAATLKRITEPWSESAVTWNTAPATTTDNMVTLAQSISSDQDYIDIDVTEMVRDMLTDPTGASGFYLQLVDEAPGNALAFFSSGATDPLKRPKLELSYSPTAISESQKATDILIYPNPSTRNFTIKISEAEHVSSYQILDAAGRVIHSKQITQTQNDLTEVVTIDLTPGVYHVQMNTPEKVIMKRFIRQ